MITTNVFFGCFFRYLCGDTRAREQFAASPWLYVDVDTTVLPMRLLVVVSEWLLLVPCVYFVCVSCVYFVCTCLCFGVPCVIPCVYLVLYLVLYLVCTLCVPCVYLYVHV